MDFIDLTWGDDEMFGVKVCDTGGGTPFISPTALVQKHEHFAGCSTNAPC